MILWDMNRIENTLTGVLDEDRDDQIGMALALAGSNPMKAWKALRAMGGGPLRLQLMKGRKRTVETRRQMIPDLLRHGTMPILSARGVVLARRLGGVEDDFWPCRLDTNPDEAFFLVVPNRVFDIVDMRKSEFLTVLPLDPPLPISLKILRTRPLSGPLPPLLLAVIDSAISSTFRDLIVRDDFKTAWEQAKFTGATFRRLC